MFTTDGLFLYVIMDGNQGKYIEKMDVASGQFLNGLSVGIYNPSVLTMGYGSVYIADYNSNGNFFAQIDEITNRVSLFGFNNMINEIVPIATNECIAVDNAGLYHIGPNSGSYKLRKELSVSSFQ